MGDVPRRGARPLTPGMANLLRVAAVLVFLAGVQLFVFPERTARYFAWTINPPLTAAFLGAAYWSSVAFEWSAARMDRWSDARIAVPAVFLFTALTLVATLLHIDLFHLGDEFETATQLVTWAWIAIYTVVPVLMVLLFVRQARVEGDEPERDGVLPRWLQALVAAQAVVLVAVGVGLFAFPGETADLWPWQLTTLTARAVGAWLVSLGVAAAHALVEREPRRLRPAAVAYLGFGVLQGVALARYPDTLQWGEPEAVAYVVFLASSVIVGAAALRAAGLGTGRSTAPAMST